MSLNTPDGSGGRRVGSIAISRRAAALRRPPSCVQSQPTSRQATLAHPDGEGLASRGIEIALVGHRLKAAGPVLELRLVADEGDRALRAVTPCEARETGDSGGLVAPAHAMAGEIFDVGLARGRGGANVPAAGASRIGLARHRCRGDRLRNLRGDDAIVTGEPSGACHRARDDTAAEPRRTRVHQRWTERIPASS